MNACTVAFLIAILVFGFGVSSGYSASAAPAKFEQQKAKQLRRIETRIAQLQEERDCISAATTQEAVKACRERSKTSKKARQL